MRTLLVAGLCIAVASSAQAQSGIFAGTVARDTLGGVIASAEVSIPELNRTTLTNPRGEFELSGIPLGRHAITVRAIGYQMIVDTIDVTAGQRVDADIVLIKSPVDLAPVKTTETTIAKRLPIGIQEMEDRRKTHLGGYFVTDSMFRANDEKKLTYFLSRIPSARLMLDTHGSTDVYLVNSRGNPMNPQQPCYMTIYIDGALFYQPGHGDPPDFNSFLANGFSGMELYPSGATTPTEYNGTGTLDCGTVLLWTRRTP
ncbi:MAG TPA: carboxypeptidase-like regulatory domain-containing protein [Gemmatimonadaceae bacterium]|jgi:hypothetical protein